MRDCALCGRSWTDDHDVCPEDAGELVPVFSGPCVLDRRYHLIRRVGRGGMGAVYKARHVGLERLVAVKLLDGGGRGEPALLERFREEARILARLEHPNVVRITDSGYDHQAQTYYLAMEYLEGTSLAEVLRRRALPPGEALPILGQIASALDHAHDRGILHRDLKPSNVVLVPSAAAGLTAKVVDFGLACFAADPELTPPLAADGTAAGQDGPAKARRSPVGTRAYLAPERLAGSPATTASDVWAFGALARATLEGSGAAEAGDGALREALDPHPARRPRRAGDVAKALLRSRQRAARRLERPRRLLLAAVLGGAFGTTAVMGGGWASTFESRTIDWRFRTAARRSPARSLLLVTIDEASLASNPAPLTDLADEVARHVESVFAAGATGVGLDILLPSGWSGSRPFSELVLKRAERVALAAYSPPEGGVLGPEAIQGLTTAALGPFAAEGLFGFVDVEPDPDGVVRRFRPLLRDLDGRWRESFATRALSVTGRRALGETDNVWLDATVDWRRFDRISWVDLPAVLEREPQRFRGRLVLVGAEFAASGDRDHRTAAGAVSGLVLQSMAVQTLLDGARIRGLPAAAEWAGATALAAAAAAAVLLLRTPQAAAAVALLAAAWVALAVGAFAGSGRLLPIAAPAAACVASALAALVIGRSLSSHSARGRP